MKYPASPNPALMLLLGAVSLSASGCIDFLCTSDESCSGGQVCMPTGVCADPAPECEVAAQCNTPPAGMLDCYDVRCEAGVCVYDVMADRICGAASCTNGTARSAPRCGQSGECMAQGSTACFPYLCNGDVCNTSCSSTADCAPGLSCDTATGVCSDPECEGAPAGTPCGDSNTTDCDLPDSCNGAGACLPNYELPDVPCGDSSSSECDAADLCDGSGSCIPNYVATGTACGDSTISSCNGADICDGQGNCDPNIVAGDCTDGEACTENEQCTGNNCTNGVCCQSGECCNALTLGVCGDYTCDLGSFTCRTSCSQDDQCAMGYHCDTGSCVLNVGNGSTCDRAEMCQSNYCQGNLCCDGGNCCDSLNDAACGDYVCNTTTSTCRTDCNNNDNALCQGAFTCYDNGSNDTCTSPANGSSCDSGSDCTSGVCGTSGMCETADCFAEENWEANMLCDFTSTASFFQVTTTLSECVTLCKAQANANCCHYVVAGTVRYCVAFDDAVGLKDAGAAVVLGARYCP